MFWWPVKVFVADGYGANRAQAQIREFVKEGRLASIPQDLEVASKLQTVNCRESGLVQCPLTLRAGVLRRHVDQRREQSYMPTDNDVFNWPIMMPRDLKLRELYGFGGAYTACAS